jgi:hypothetical protein
MLTSTDVAIVATTDVMALAESPDAAAKAGQASRAPIQTYVGVYLGPPRMTLTRRSWSL